jgi:NAD-dependent dihydropyrimidine dehydrogenase PreA subunit
MSGDAYERLAVALDGLANGFPRTESNAELRILRHVFTPDEAEVAAALTGRPTAAADVARRAALEPARVTATLESLAQRGVIWMGSVGGDPGYRLAPFVVGFYEAHMLETRDVEFARLVEEYFCGGGAVGIMSPQPAIHRVLPARGATSTEWVLPYDDVRAILGKASSFRVEPCVCRLQQDELGMRRCDSPLETCLWFSYAESSDEASGISHEEALAVLDEAEHVGLVHTVSNVASGIGYVCNCCGCCCGLLRGITEWGIEHSVAQANYFAEIDPLTCTACGACEERCQVDAIVVRDDGARVARRESCIGCGLCVTGCPTEAARLRRKPEDEIVAPPATRGAWERVRLRGRSVSATSPAPKGTPA